jgi:hypothetical protein
MGEERFVIFLFPFGERAQQLRIFLTSFFQ